MFSLPWRALFPCPCSNLKLKMLFSSPSISTPNPNSLHKQLHSNPSLILHDNTHKPLPVSSSSFIQTLNHETQKEKLNQELVKTISPIPQFHGKTLVQAFEFLRNDQTSFGFCALEVYAQILELCGSYKALSQGEQIHAQLVKRGFLCDNDESSVFFSTKLIFMYGKCGSIFNAENMFDKMSQRTIFTWNAMIGAYVANDHSLCSLKLFKKMMELGVWMDAYTFPSLLRACGSIKDVCCGSAIHGIAIKLGYVSTMFVVNAVISMYAKCNELDAARQLFDGTCFKEDIVTWNSIISAYSANGESLEALELFRELQIMGPSMNSYTIIAALQASENLGYGKLGMEIHAALLRSGQDLDVYVGNALIATYARSGNMSKASLVFNSLTHRDNVSWNSLISGFVQNDQYKKVLDMFLQMQEVGEEPDKVSIMSIIATSSRTGDLLHGMEAHAYALRRCLDLDLHIGNTLVDMYAKCCQVKDMGYVFERMPDKDTISWTTVMVGYAQNNCHVNAVDYFREAQIRRISVDKMMMGSALIACSGLKNIHLVMEVHGFMFRRGLSDHVLHNMIVDAYGMCRNTDYASRVFALIEEKDVVSWTSMVSCYIHNGLTHEALDIFLSMKETGIEADYVALVCALSIAANISVLAKGKEVHGYIIRKGFSLKGSLACSLVDMYARCGHLEDSCKVFNSTTNKDLNLWTAMINACGMHGLGMVAIELFNKMIEQNIIPDHITFLAIIYACSHSGLLVEGKRYFDIMRNDYHLEPWPEHYACLVDLLGRANSLEEAYQFTETMPIEPTAEVWSALLQACKIHSNKELGEIAMQKLLHESPEHPGNYILVSNVFAATGRWKDVEDLRLRMKGGGLNKTPGCSWIEVGGKLHSFIARDKSHPESDDIYLKLAEITARLVQEGYVAQTKFVLHNVEEEEKVQMLYGHSERLAIAYSLLKTQEGTPIRISKNLRVCGDCHTFCKLVSKHFGLKLVVRDANRFHHFDGGVCSCGDFW